MKLRSLLLILMSALLLVACGKGNAIAEQPASQAAPTDETVAVAPAPAATPLEQMLVVIAPATDSVTQAPAMTMPPTPEPTEAPTPAPTDTPEPTETPVPMLGVLDGKFADKFVIGKPVITENSYQSERVAIFLNYVVDDSKTLTKHTFNYFVADVYFQDMEDFRSGTAKSWAYSDRWGKADLSVIAKKHNAIFAVSGDFTLTREKGLILRNGEEIKGKNGSTHGHDPKRDVGVIYRDGRMETYTAQNTPADQLLNDPNVWQILGFGPELLDENGQPKTQFNDPSKVSRANIRNAVGYFEPGHYCFVYVPPYKVRKDDTCLDMECLSRLMYSLGCVRAYNLDGGATAGMYFNGKMVIGRKLGQNRENHDIYYIPAA